ncbi:MAG TPA: hypothetical protein GX400_14780 [Chloroflexi bacterium]|nr:hypothetical protein [Chloroflexota bacterium]
MLLAGLRLLLLYALACCVLLAIGLLWRTTLERGAGLSSTLPRPDAPGATPPFAGVTLQLAGRPPVFIATRLAELRAAGFGWVRLHFNWSAIEPAPGRFDWSETDRLVAAITNAGLEPVVVLNTTPDWALAPEDAVAANRLAPPSDFTDFARFAAAFARRYGDRVRYYQLWDEPNIAPHWGARHINPVGYAQMLRTAAPAVRAADADAVILAAALAPTADRGHLAIDEVYFLQRMLAAGAAPFFDVVAVQPFGFGFSPTHSRQDVATLNFARAALIRRTLVGAGLGDKPIWAVRYGWNRLPNSPWGAVTPAAQAEYAVGALERAWREWSWLTAMGWVIDQPAEAPGMPAWGFALTNASGTPAPVYSALADWQTTPHIRVKSSASPSLWLAWGGLLLISLLIAWRTVAALRLIDWRGWLEQFQRAPRWLHGVAWLALIVIYYLATFPPLIGLCWLATLLLCLAQPQVGLWLAVALIPFYFQHKEVQLVGVILTVPPSHVLAVALAPALYFSRQLSTANLRHASPSMPRALRPFHWWELSPVLLLPLSLLATVHVWHWPAFVRGMLDLVMAPLLLWLSVRVLAVTAVERQRVLAALFAGGALAALVGLLNWLTGRSAEVDGIRRLVGPHFSANHTALYLERSLFLGLALVMTLRRWPGRAVRVAAWSAVLVVALALALTGSRGALLLGAPAGLAVMGGWTLARRPAVRRWLRLRRRRLGLMLIGASVLALLVMLWQQARLANVETVVLRLELWRAALALWRDHFWAGVGPGGFFWSYPAYLPVGAVEVDQLHPHNVWLEVAVTWGVGGVAWLALSGMALVKALQQQRNTDSVTAWVVVGAVAGLAAGLAHAQTDTFMLLADVAAWNAVAWALATAPPDGTMAAPQSRARASA